MKSLAAPLILHGIFTPLVHFFVFTYGLAVLHYIELEYIWVDSKVGCMLSLFACVSQMVSPRPELVKLLALSNFPAHVHRIIGHIKSMRMVFWPCCMFLTMFLCMTSWPCVHSTFVSLTEGRSARDLSKHAAVAESLDEKYTYQSRCTKCPCFGALFSNPAWSSSISQFVNNTYQQPKLFLAHKATVFWISELVNESDSQLVSESATQLVCSLIKLLKQSVCQIAS